MAAPENTFKTRLLAGQTLWGCWAGFADSYATEVLSTAEFDWLVLDGEHAPNDLRSLMGQLQVLQGKHSHGVVRLPVGNEWLIKQMLDAGAQTLLIPMVETPEQAALREVAEETGIESSIERALGVIDFWFMAGGKRIHKTVHHYLFRETGGTLAPQESEVDEVGWFPLSEIVERLAYPDEKKLIARTEASVELDAK